MGIINPVDGVMVGTGTMQFLIEKRIYEPDQ